MKQSLSHYLHLTIILCPSPGQDECLRAVIACHETHICTVSQCSSSNHSCKCWPQCCKDNNKSVNMPLIFAFSTFSLPSYLIFVWKETLKYRKSLQAGARCNCHQLLYGPHLSDKKVETNWTIVHPLIFSVFRKQEKQETGPCFNCVFVKTGKLC